jgi:dTDP-4-amino-4,6-dideoxygalactose transaminase
MLIPMNDFRVQYNLIKKEIDEAIERVLESGWYILGENVKMFEKEFADYCGAKFAIGVGNGLEALQLALLTYGVGENDEVITVANTSVATALAISSTGAKPVFVDIDCETYGMDVSEIRKEITTKTKAILPVHLFGHPVNMDPLMEIAAENNLVVIEDACQAHGSEYNGKKIGSIGQAGCFSFYPTKNLGGCGDGGMIITNQEEIAHKIFSLRNYGQKTRYLNEFRGINSRLDEIQAAILRIKLKHLDEWNEKRRKIAQFYTESLENVGLVCPKEMDYARHVYHLYVIRYEERGNLQSFLGSRGITTLVHYPIPIHLQNAYKDLHVVSGALPVTEKLAEEILSLPIFPELRKDQIEEVADSVKLFLRQNSS